MTSPTTIRVSPSPFRIWMGIFALMGLGAILLYLGLGMPNVTYPVRGLLVLCGLGAIFGGWRMMQAGQLELELTETELRDSAGRLVAAVDNIKKVERGAFALKPSHGFLLHLEQPMDRAWYPGVWWRFGRRVAVGGILPSGQAKAMADMIAARQAGVDI